MLDKEGSFMGIHGCMSFTISQAHPHHPGELRLILEGGTSPLSLRLAEEEGSLPKEIMIRLIQDEPVEGE